LARRSENETQSLVESLTRRGKSGASLFSKRKQKKTTNLDELTQAELAWAKDYAAVLKAVGFSWRYISDTLNIQTGLVKSFADEPDFNEKVAKVAADKVEGAVNHMKAASVELTEYLLEIARNEPDSKIRLQAIVEGLDRVGITKVNKSESVVTKNENTTLTPSEDFFERLETLPLETQRQIADLSRQMEELVMTSRGTE
jgi:hypothetical protein